jgi:hypothetical protein
MGEIVFQHPPKSAPGRIADTVHRLSNRFIQRTRMIQPDCFLCLHNRIEKELSNDAGRFVA